METPFWKFYYIGHETTVNLLSIALGATIVTFRTAECAANIHGTNDDLKIWKYKTVTKCTYLLINLRPTKVVTLFPESKFACDRK